MPQCATACINICAHVKDSAVHVRVRWIMETLKHPACTLGWVVWLCCSCLSPGKATQISHGRNPKGTIQQLKKRRKKNSEKIRIVCIIVQCNFIAKWQMRKECVWMSRSSCWCGWGTAAASSVTWFLSSKLQADMKVTKVEEMKVQMEALYQEIVRLQNVKSSSSTKWVMKGSLKAWSRLEYSLVCVTYCHEIFLLASNVLFFS